MDEERNREIQKKAFLYTGIIFLILTIATQWYATQAVAQACNYDAHLGKYLSIGGMKLYPPFGYFLWSSDAMLSQTIPDILDDYSSLGTIVLFLSFGIMYLIKKGLRVQTSHGSAAFAGKADIEKSDLGEYVSKNGGVFEYAKRQAHLFGFPLPFQTKHKIVKDSGVVVGINPYTHKLMLHDGVEHIILMAPTRSGKGVCTIVPTGLIWKHSIFFFDPKCELWNLTSGYRQKVLKQKALKFQPLCIDGSAARWNPLAEINYRTPEELSDVQSVVSVMVRPDGDSKGDEFWPNAAAALLNGVILHLLYKHDRENLPLPCPTDIMSFLSSPDKDTKELFTGMRDYGHICPEEFLEVVETDEAGNPILDEVGIPKRKHNPLKEIYGEYIKDFRPFTKALGVVVRSLDEIRIAIEEKMKRGEAIEWDAEDSDGYASKEPYHLLLTHPKVAECAANILNGADQTTASIMQTAQTSMAIYQDPAVQRNTSVSDFAIQDLLDPNQTVSLYFCMQLKEIATVKPIARLFLQLLCSKLIRDMKFETDPNKPKPKKQRLLLMLDEFPQLGNMKCIELALAICAGYGIKMCIVSQDVNQLNKEYTKDNSIGSNCHVHIYFTPNNDNGNATAEGVSKALGKRTISTVSHSDGGGGWFKGSDSTSQTGRELMTPDEVGQMSAEKELVFVAGHRPIYGDKLRYYEYPFLVKRTQVQCPAISDAATRVTSYAEMADVQKGDRKLKEEARRKVLEEEARQLGEDYGAYRKRLEFERQNRENAFRKTIQESREKSDEKNSHKKDDSEKRAENSRPAEGRRNDARTEDPKAVNPAETPDETAQDLAAVVASSDIEMAALYDSIQDGEGEVLSGTSPDELSRQILSVAIDMEETPQELSEAPEEADALEDFVGGAALGK